ncbi:hAT transposon superfamily protein [Euphorbia peplus]|nr:hAT transposon superfamily protein [Euphorbia peplus]
MESNSEEANETPSLKRKSNDVGWEYGVLINPNNLEKVKCKLCGKEFSGGVYSLKKHIARIQGDVAGCPYSKKEDQDKCKLAIMEARKKRSKSK